MGAIDAIGSEARRAVLEVMITMAWADRRLEPEERQAAHAAAISLGLVLPADRGVTCVDRPPVSLEELDVSSLRPRDRELVYLCAAWMAVADAVEEPEERDLLARLRARLGLAEERARWLEQRAMELRKQQSVARTTWCRSFDTLVVEAARVLEKNTD